MHAFKTQFLHDKVNYHNSTNKGGKRRDALPIFLFLSYT